eukprot:353152-Chlamydomonas_euryale.AAC.8
MARVRMLPGRRSAGSRSLKAFPAAERRLCRWGVCNGSSAVMRPRWRVWETRVIASQVPGTLSGGRAATSPTVAGCMQTASHLA